jgi:hypothetical protein
MIPSLSAFNQELLSGSRVSFLSYQIISLTFMAAACSR